MLVWFGLDRGQFHLRETLQFFSGCGLEIPRLRDAHIHSKDFDLHLVRFDCTTLPDRTFGEFSATSISFPKVRAIASIKLNRICPNGKKAFTIIHELCHALDALVLGTGFKYASQGQYGNLPPNVVQALKTIRSYMLSPVNTERAKAWKKKRQTAYEQIADSLKIKVKTYLSFRQHLLKPQDSKRFIKMANAQRDICKTILRDVDYYIDPREMFADAFSLYLTGYVYRGGSLTSVSYGQFQSIFKAESAQNANRYNEMFESLNELFELTQLANRLEPMSVEVGFTSEEIETLRPYFDIVWNHIQVSAAVGMQMHHAKLVFVR